MTNQAHFCFRSKSRNRAFLDLAEQRLAQDRPAASPVTSLDSLRAAVPPSTALIVYHSDARSTFAWVVRRDGLNSVMITASAPSIADDVASLRKQIEQRTASDLPRQLYGRFIAPLGLRQNEDVVIVPSASLYDLPFQALEGPKGAFINERAVSYLPTASSIFNSAGAAAPAAASLLEIANPDLGDPKYSLPGSEQEAKAIAATMGPSTEVLIRRQATAAALTQRAPKYQMLHVAAHAFVDNIDPLSSRILLAGDTIESGAFEARRFYGLDLSHTRLIVLSACETGLGAVKHGGEFYGFQRTVLASGAPTLVASAVECVGRSDRASHEHLL